MTTPRRPTPSRSASVRGAPLGRALEEAAQVAAAQLGADAADPSAVAEELTRLCAHASALADGAEPSNGPGVAPFNREHVDKFRRVFLARLAEGHPKRANAQAVVAVLRALDGVATDDAGALTRSAVEHIVRADALNGMLEIAHDMRSPLAAILLLVDPIRRGQYGPVTETQERQLGLVYGAALSLSTLANDIIDAARGERGAEPTQHPFSVSNTIHDACSVVRPIAEEKGLELRHEYPASDGRIGDASAIHRILLNLTSNALKYTERGSVTVGCTELDGERVEFWVQDTGRGIPDHVLERLFEEFRPGPVGSRFFSSGLGLSICRRLVQQMGGELKVDTGPEKGTRFSFIIELPATQTEPPAAPSL